MSTDIFFIKMIYGAEKINIMKAVNIQELLIRSVLMLSGKGLKGIISYSIIKEIIIHFFEYKHVYVYFDFKTSSIKYLYWNVIVPHYIYYMLKLLFQLTEF